MTINNVPFIKISKLEILGLSADSILGNTVEHMVTDNSLEKKFVDSKKLFFHKNYLKARENECDCCCQVVYRENGKRSWPWTKDSPDGQGNGMCMLALIKSII